LKDCSADMGWPQNAGCCILAISKSGIKYAEETFSAE
jgi:hypothetical protein